MRVPGQMGESGPAELHLPGQRFRIIRRLGEGAAGVVYEAHDLSTDTRLALKTLRQLEPSALLRFKNEFRSLADLAHPNLVRLHELFTTGDDWFFTMELISGQSFTRH